MKNKITLELTVEQEKLLKFALIRLESDVSKNENYDLNNNLFYGDLANQVWNKSNSKGIDYTPWSQD